MKVLFLDMDGVLNSYNWFKTINLPDRQRTRRRAKIALREAFRRADIGSFRIGAIDSYSCMVDPAAIRVLNHVIEQTGAKVVLSSSWRIVWPYRAVEVMLRTAGFVGELIGATPNGVVGKPHARGNEIQAWLDEHPEVTAFAIVDDSSDMVHLLPKLVRTTWHSGLEIKHAAPLITHLT